jgi:hypothetical protein
MWLSEREVHTLQLSEPEAIFNFSFAAQVANPKEENAKALNKRIQ